MGRCVGGGGGFPVGRQVQPPPRRLRPSPARCAPPRFARLRSCAAAGGAQGWGEPVGSKKTQKRPQNIRPPPRKAAHAERAPGTGPRALRPGPAPAGSTSCWRTAPPGGRGGRGAGRARPLLPRGRQRGRAGGREGRSAAAARAAAPAPAPPPPLPRAAVATSYRMKAGRPRSPSSGRGAERSRRRARGGAGRRARRPQVRLSHRSAPRPRGKAGQGARKGRAGAQRGARSGMLPSFPPLPPLVVLFSPLPLF